MKGSTIRTILAGALLIAMLAISVVPAPLASPSSPATSSNSLLSAHSVAPSIADLLSSAPTARAGQGYERTIYKGLLNTEWVQDFSSKYSGLLSKTYATSFGVNMKEPFGLLVGLGKLDLPTLHLITERHGGTVAKYWRQINTALVVLPANPVKVRQLSLELARAGASYVAPDMVRKPAMWDTAAIFNLYNIWRNLGLNGTGVLVSVIDTGVDPSNPSIPNPDHWVDFVNGNNASAYDDIGHGTHVAGIILGREYSLFPDSDAMWHAMLVGESSNFNPAVDKANLTYKIDVSAYQGDTLTVKFQHLYVLYEKYNASGSYYYFKANASVWVSFDGSTWTKLAQYNGNQTSPVVESLSVTVPSSATSMYLRFSYDYILKANGTNYDFSEWDILGWFINNVTVKAGATTVYDDPVSGLTLPPEVVENNYWVRVEDKFRGMAPNASLAAAKVCGPSGCADSAILQAMNWSLNIGANIVSMSLGGPASSYDALAQMADYLVDHGVLVVIAAGNEGPYYYNVSSPGISRKALTVAAATKQRTIAWFSSPGPSPVGGWLKPDVAAIGYDLASSIPTNSSVTGIPWAGSLPYAAWSGTSMATPMVSGLAALVKQAHPSWNATLIKSAIIASADWLATNRYMGSPYDMYKQGAGMIDPHQAVNMTLVPLEANIWLGNYSATSSNYINYTIKLVNTDPAKAASVQISEIGFYRIIANGTYYTATVQNMSSLVEKPVIGQSLTVPAGGSATIQLSINLTKLGTLPGGMYAGYIAMNTNTSGPIKVIFSAKIKGVSIVEGYITDYEAGTPISNATIYIYNSTYNGKPLGEIANTTTDTSGHYMVTLPDNVSYVTVVVDASRQGYFWHISYTLALPASGKLTYNASLLKEPSPGEIPAIIMIDRYASPLVSSAIKTVKSVAESLGLTPVVWPASKLGRIGGPVVQGWLDLRAPIMFYLAGGFYYPLSDPVDMNALSWAANHSGTLLVVSSGDLAWSHHYDKNETKWMVTVLHANFTKDLDPDNYTSSVYNVSSLSTLFGYTVFLENLGSPASKVIGNISIYNISEYYFPDEIVPENSGIAAASWNSPAANYSMVLYLGGGSQSMRTAFLSFELEQLDNATRQALVDRLIALAVDAGGPVLAGYLPYTLNNGVLTLEPGSPGLGIVEPYPLGYTITVTDNATHTVIARLNTTSLPASINLGGTATPGSLLLVDLTVADRAGHLAVFSPASIVKYLEGNGTNYFIADAGTYPLSVPEAGTSMYVEVAGRAVVQLLKVPVSSVPALPPSLADHSRYRIVIALDLYARNIDASALNSITLTVPIPRGVDAARINKTRIAYWNGTAWAPVSNYKIDTSNMTVIITINSSTSPNITELGGTPIILSYPAPEVGGVLLSAPHQATASVVPALIAAIAGLAVAVATARKR